MGRAYGTPRHLRRSCGRRRDSSRSSVPNRLVRSRDRSGRRGPVENQERHRRVVGRSLR